MKSHFRIFLLRWRLTRLLTERELRLARLAGAVSQAERRQLMREWGDLVDASRDVESDLREAGGLPEPYDAITAMWWVCGIIIAASAAIALWA
jgi:hypothetical protein